MNFKIKNCSIVSNVSYETYYQKRIPESLRKELTEKVLELKEFDAFLDIKENLNEIFINTILKYYKVNKKFELEYDLEVDRSHSLFYKYHLNENEFYIKSINISLSSRTKSKASNYFMQTWAPKILIELEICDEDIKNKIKTKVWDDFSNIRWMGYKGKTFWKAEKILNNQKIEIFNMLNWNKTLESDFTLFHKEIIDYLDSNPLWKSLIPFIKEDELKEYWKKVWYRYDKWNFKDSDFLLNLLKTRNKELWKQ